MGKRKTHKMEKSQFGHLVHAARPCCEQSPVIKGEQRSQVGGTMHDLPINSL